MTIRTAPFSDQERAFTLDYFLCFASFFALLLNSLYGMWAIVAFMLPWLWIWIRKNRACYKALLANWPLFLFPVLTFASAGWSDNRMWTLKASIEIGLTIAIGILAATCVKPRQMIAALLSAFLVIAVLCIITMWSILLASTGDAYIYGIFGSKNAFADNMALFLLIAVAALIDRQQSIIIRLIALLSLLLSPVLVYLGHSLGSSLAVVMTLAICVGMYYAKRLPSSLRILTLYSLAILTVLVMAASLLTEFNAGQILAFFGKDTSLTGRTLLWNHAIQNIAERPLLGTGFGAFWELQNPEAQRLWFESHVRAGAGFNFHNEYLETLVELGLVGFALLVGYLAIMTRNAYRSVFSPSPRPEQAFAFIMFIFYMIRTPVEVRLLGQFNIGMILFCVLWVYLKPSLPEKAKAAPPVNFYVPPQAKIQNPWQM